jgi:hypothetical protein
MGKKPQMFEYYFPVDIKTFFSLEYVSDSSNTLLLRIKVIHQQ